jgi:MoxR-like ATPase
MKLSVGYPTLDEEQEILRRRRERQQDDVNLKPITNSVELAEMRTALEQVYIDPDIEKYMVALVAATRKDSRIAVGASPRASLAFMKLARAWAVLNGRTFVLPDDVKQFIQPVLVHRLILQPDLWMKRNAAQDVIQKVTSVVPVPVTEV